MSIFADSIRANPDLSLKEYQPHMGIRVVVVTAIALTIIFRLLSLVNFTHLNDWTLPNLWKPLLSIGQLY